MFAIGRWLQLISLSWTTSGLAGRSCTLRILLRTVQIGIDLHRSAARENPEDGAPYIALLMSFSVEHFLPGGEREKRFW